MNKFFLGACLLSLGFFWACQKEAVSDATSNANVGIVTDRGAQTPITHLFRGDSTHCVGDSTHNHHPHDSTWTGWGHHGHHGDSTWTGGGHMHDSTHVHNDSTWTGGGHHGGGHHGGGHHGGGHGNGGGHGHGGN